MQPRRNRWLFAFTLPLVPLAPMPTPALAQTPPAQATSIPDQVKQLSDRVAAMRAQAEQARDKCDLATLQSLLPQAQELLQESVKLANKAQTAPGLTEADYRRAEQANGSARSLAQTIPFYIGDVEWKCRKKEQAASGTAPGQTFTPYTPPDPKYPIWTHTQLWEDAMAAFLAHYGFAVNCDEAGMSGQRAKLESYTREARASGSKMRQRAAKGKETQTDANSATQLERAIEALWLAALSQPPFPCPRTGVEPLKQQVPEQPEQQQQQEELTPPKYGLRFTPPDRDSERVLARINYYRRDAGMTALTWDRELAGMAEARALEMAGTGLVHQRRTGPRRFGENILQSLRGQRSVEQMVDIWGREKRYFVAGTFPNISTTGDWSAAGHYSQIVWSGSVWVGCGTYGSGVYDWTVCAFYPAGNKDGKLVFGPPPGPDLEPFMPPK